MANLADVLFAYSLAELPASTEGRVFFNKLEKFLLDKIILKDYFNTINSSRIQWALAKQANAELIPLYSSDPSGSILMRRDFGRVASVQHRIFKEINRQVIAKRKHAEPLNLAVTLFAQSTINLHDQELFEQTFLHFKDSGSTPRIDELGYLAQAAATLRRAEYTAFLIKWFDESISAPSTFSNEWHLRNEFSIA